MTSGVIPFSILMKMVDDATNCDRLRSGIHTDSECPRFYLGTHGDLSLQDSG